MNEKKIYCVTCGEDITRQMKFYPYGVNGGAYCYFCKCKIKKKEKDEAEQYDSQILTMYKRGLKPSQIAQKMQMDTKEVYEILTAILEGR